MRDLLRQIDPIDLLAVASVAVLTIGAAMVFVPAAFVLAGGLGLVYAIAVSRSEPPSTPPEKPA